MPGSSKSLFVSTAGKLSLVFISFLLFGGFFFFSSLLSFLFLFSLPFLFYFSLYNCLSEGESISITNFLLSYLHVKIIF